MSKGILVETERTILREIIESDAEFIFDLLNQPSFIKYIGNRNVHTLDDARDFIENRYRESYREHGFGLYLVELKENRAAIGICGFVQREGLTDADIGFAFLPQYEKKGYAYESADAIVKYGREKLNLKRILAIATQNNENSHRLLEKLGFKYERLIKLPHGEEQLKLFSTET
ncbi:MAG TPA: GNAT family N-acetyltransferase [Pyrinomonadaceae bacterium]|jgi:RimJ/RimL family protein N-acetyltransferase